MFLFSKKTFVGFINAFLAGLLAWGIFCVIAYFSGSDIIANRTAKLMKAMNGNVLIIVVSLLAGLLAGFSGATGSALRSIFVKKRSDYY